MDGEESLTSKTRLFKKEFERSKCRWQHYMNIEDGEYEVGDYLRALYLKLDRLINRLLLANYLASIQFKNSN